MKLKVLVVDDETPICDWLVYCIRRASEDYVVDAASNGEEAMEKILQQHPDLVITDIRMPRMDGLELMRKTQEILPFTNFVILTNYAEFSYAKEAVSLGAKEYILKSEMRAVDVEKLLVAMMAAKASKVNEKVEDVFFSGCIDLYNFYSTQEEPGFADRFWEKQGLWKDIPYCILCISACSGRDAWKTLAMHAEALRSAGEGNVYSVVASEKDFEYFVVQAQEDLDQWVDRLIGLLESQGNIGISSRIATRNEFAIGLQEASCAQSAVFFEKEKKILRYDEICIRPSLDRDGLRSQRKDILDMLIQHRFEEALISMEQWYEKISQPSVEDAKWAMDYCRRMVLAIEEQYDRENTKTDHGVTIQKSLMDCQNRCRELLDGMQHSYIRRYSSSIAAAVEFIHENYGSHISMADTAKQVYRSPEYFSRQFKEEVGENFNTYLTLYRLDRAQEMLDHTDMRIVEVAEKVGYTTPGYFSRLYKKYKGITPEQARMSKNNKKSQKITYTYKEM